MIIRPFFRIGAALFALCVVAGCAPRKRAALIVRVSSDIARSDLTRLEYTINSITASGIPVPIDFNAHDPTQPFPGNLRIEQRDGAIAAEVELAITPRTGAPYTQRARASFTSGEWRQIDMFIARQCLDSAVQTRCQMESTTVRPVVCGSSDPLNPCVPVVRTETVAYVEPDAGSPVPDAGVARAEPRSFPWSGARLSSGNVTVRWVLPSGATEARVSVCRDFQCTSATMDTMGTDRATLTLPVGRHVVRIQPLMNSMPAGAPMLRAVEITTDASTPAVAVGTSMFMNPIDTLRDFAFGARQLSGGRVEVNGLAGTLCPFIYSETTTTPAFGRVVRNAGDFNGDGFSDVIVLSQGVLDTNVPRAALGLRAPYTAPSGTIGFRWQPSFFDVPSASIIQPAWSASGGGDINGDGYSDFVIGLPTIVSMPGEARVVFGNPSPIDNGVASSVSPSITGDHPTFGGSVASGCDLDGDGFADFAVGSVTANRTSSAARPVRVYFGGPSAPYASTTIDVPSALLMGISPQRFGDSIVCGADLDGDGLSELAVGDTEAFAGAARVGMVSVFSLRGRTARALGATSGAMAGNSDYGAALTMGHIPSATNPATPVLIVGAPNAGAASQGEVKVYRYNAGELEVLHYFGGFLPGARGGTSVAIAEVNSFANETVVLMGVAGRCSDNGVGMTMVDGCVVGFAPRSNPMRDVTMFQTLLAWEPITGTGVGTTMTH